MNKFYLILAVAVLAGLGLVFLQGSNSIDFDDLETECRIQDSHEANYDLRPDSSLGFEGNFPVENTEAEISHSFKRKEDLIKLRVSSSEKERPKIFDHSCLGSVVYSGETEPIDSGTYFLEIYHNDRQVERSIVRIE